ncbi:hypothetical protein Dvina_09690 [Dactylosporangium vinaceum]|uniref:Uncharacterized protein n=1 Tax=Dactylosporangium vinaceum TaxID=53362 RepID=A0ABV5MB52_9ACTN|nr:hypothetical protein [Dactylosporangium vinaceum]UAB98329.1 hypothetical protein Dvina_09690 [Dactylosporangium vinaceum]
MGDQSGFVADPGTVRAFGADLQRDLDIHLSAEKVETLHLFSGAPVFGLRAVSAEVQQTARDYVARLQDLFELMEVLLHNGAVLARAAHSVADAYESADTLTADQVSGALGNARASVSAETSATDPETGRLV